MLFDEGIERRAGAEDLELGGLPVRLRELRILVPGGQNSIGRLLFARLGCRRGGLGPSGGLQDARDFGAGEPGRRGNAGNVHSPAEFALPFRGAADRGDAQQGLDLVDAQSRVERKSSEWLEEFPERLARGGAHRGVTPFRRCSGILRPHALTV